MKHYFPALTGFRAAAAWVVFAQHYNPFPRDQFISKLVNEGYISLSLFFVLSGFLITVRYDDPMSSRPGFGQYMLNRFGRIYPLYFLLTTVTFIVFGDWSWIYIANITFVRGFFDDLKFTGIAQAWSLTVEESFYILAPLIWFLIRRNKLAWLLPVVFLLIGLAIYGSDEFMYVYTIFGRSFEFFVGIALAKYYHNKRPAASDHQRFTWIGLAGISASVLLLALVVGEVKYAVFTIPGLLIHHLLVPTSTALFLLGLMTETTWVRKFLSTSVMQVLGKSSYAFYLIHIGVIATWLSSNTIVIFVLVNLLAIGLYYAVEKPLHEVISRKGQNSLN